jgi:hypothetical protein
MPLGQEELSELARLGQALIDAEEAVEKAEQALKDRKAELRKLVESEIPDYMQECGVSKVTLDGGATIGYKDDVRLEWDEAKKANAFEWLESNDFGGLIKTGVTASFGKGELEKAKELLSKLSESGLEVALKRDVHYQTMCAFLREQIAAGTAIPLEEWGAVAIKKADVKMPRARRIDTQVRT